MLTADTESPGEQGFKSIKRDIVSGLLPPGQKLKLDALRARYDISVSTLREILARLAAEHLVVAEGQKGFQVAPATQAELIELGELRLLLEGYAVDRSFSDGDLEWEARVVSSHHKLASIESRLLKGEIERTAEWVRYDWDFHQALISACASRSLMATLSLVFDRFLRYHLLAETFRGAPVVADHKALFELAMKRDAAGAKAKLAEHVANGIQHVISSGKIPR